jgi:hypothetical protein
LSTSSSDDVDFSITNELIECLRVLFEQVEIIGRLTNVHQRDQYLSALLSGSRDIDIRLMEAVKVLMMLNAISTYEADRPTTATAGTDPVVIWQMMSSDTSLTAEMFFHNHINCVRNIGDVLCSQQLELSFLAYCLGLRVQVFQAPFAGRSDALRHYPDEGADHLPQIRIVRCDEPMRYYVPIVSN